MMCTDRAGQAGIAKIVAEFAMHEQALEIAAWRGPVTGNVATNAKMNFKVACRIELTSTERGKARIENGALFAVALGKERAGGRIGLGRVEAIMV
jgi:hypothetical protein